MSKHSPKKKTGILQSSRSCSCKGQMRGVGPDWAHRPVLCVGASTSLVGACTSLVCRAHAGSHPLQCLQQFQALVPHAVCSARVWSKTCAADSTCTRAALCARSAQGWPVGLIWTGPRCSTWGRSTMDTACSIFPGPARMHCMPHVQQVQTSVLHAELRARVGTHAARRLV